MLKIIKSFAMIMASVTLSTLLLQPAYSDDYESIKSLVNRYHGSTDKNIRKEAVKKLGQTVPRTQDDMAELRKILSKSDFEEGLFLAGMDAVQVISDPSLDAELIGILEDQKFLHEKAAKKDFAGKTEQEMNYRGMSVLFAIEKLGNLKSQKAVAILREYLKIDIFRYYASAALSKIGDKSASEEIRERAYRGEQVIYGGQGLSEALRVIQDLEDKSKKDKWNKIAGQLKSINDPGAKPYLKKLFNHEQLYVRSEAAKIFSRMANINDANDLIEMAKNDDDSVRSSAIEAMMLLKDVQFDDLLIQILASDPDWLPRSEAARALGYKKVQKAVPYLENALKDKAIAVRKEAFISLYVLTRKKYDFAGHKPIDDVVAERQLVSPTIY